MFQIERLCLNCNKEIPKSRSSLAKCCSNECNTQYQNNKKINPKPCDICRTNIITRYKNGKINRCKECATKERAERGWTTIKCSYCEIEFKRKKSRVKEGVNFCSRECRGKHQMNREVRQCANCGIDVKRKASDFKRVDDPNRDREYIYCSVKCMGEHYQSEKLFTGENNEMWRGGGEYYYGENWRKQRRKARERDNYTCQHCGIKEEDNNKQLSVHHIKLFRSFNGDYISANKLDNLISLCEPCHRAVHAKMDKKTKNN